ncbi:MAG TPA: ribonuclease J [Anaerolineae bacterium]|nr:ribonuclease J [Anaerolineae bacterium]HID83875.1 ribonuclease J [Anaerolineales bacterium]HIQ08928.1 ribonuclease J [Anaerolineaceae bacterium]
MSKKKLRIIPLGGAGEIGKNMTVYEYGDDILIVDTGIMFPTNDMLGIDYIIPDFQYLLDKRHKVRGIVITHGHEDHTGAIHHVVSQIQAPIYATPLTMGLLENKLSRGGLKDKVSLHTVRAGEAVQIGPFKVEFFHVCHSIPDAVGLGITTPEGLIVQTGDYKFDHTPVDGWPTDYAKLAEFGQRGVLALLADSTNADKAGWTPSEQVIKPAFEQVFREAKGRILVATFASQISRVQQVADVALEHGRKITFVGTSMVENVKIARKLGYLDIPEAMILPLDQALKLPDEQVLLMCTGSQGEPSSIMGRLSMGTNRAFDLKPGDTVVLSAHPIPGNEENVYRTINRLFRRGAKVIYDPIVPVHVSGHASQEEMKLMIHLVRPKYLLPVHGELRHLHQHAAMGRELGIPEDHIVIIENGQVVEFQNGQMSLGERVPGGWVFVDGSSVGEVSMKVVREREALARDGFVLVNLTVDRLTGRLLDAPEIITRGFVYTEGAQDLLAAIRKRVVKAVNTSSGNLQRDVQQMLRSYLYNETKRRPQIFVSVSEIEPAAAPEKAGKVPTWAS